MGTNYYAIPKFDEEKIKSKIIYNVESDNLDDAIDLINELKTNKQGIHIGKSSMGWKFCFDHQNWKYFKKDKQSIIDFINSCELHDEYHCEISPEEFWKLVESKQTGIDNKEYYTNWQKHNIGLDGKAVEPSYVPADYGQLYVEDLNFCTSTNFS